MTREHIFDDLSNRRNLPKLLAWAHAHGPVMPLGEVARIANGKAAQVDVNAHGRHWLRALVSLIERTGLGRLERDERGTMVVRFVQPLPTDTDLDEAWDRAYWSDD